MVDDSVARISKSSSKSLDSWYEISDKPEESKITTDELIKTLKTVVSTQQQLMERLDKLGINNKDTKRELEKLKKLNDVLENVSLGSAENTKKFVKNYGKEQTIGQSFIDFVQQLIHEILPSVREKDEINALDKITSIIKKIDNNAIVY